MVLFLVSLVLLGLALTADCPRAPQQDDSPAVAVPRSLAVRHDAPTPRESTRAVRVRLRAHVPERDEDPSRAGAAVTEALAPPRAADLARRGAPFASLPCLAALVYVFCALLC